MRGWLACVLLVAGGCGGEAECGPAECADICAKEVAPAPAPAPEKPSEPEPAASSGLTDFEKELLASTIEDVQKGVRPFDAEGFGVCRGTGRECEGFLGADAGELPQGDYIIQARLAVPQIGGEGTWKVKFASSCDTIRVAKDGSETRTTKEHDRVYEVRYGGPGSPYRLSPLRKVTSPAKGGRQECTYSLTMLRPDREDVLKGSYTVPAE